MVGGIHLFCINHRVKVCEIRKLLNKYNAKHNIPLIKSATTVFLIYKFCEICFMHTIFSKMFHTPYNFHRSKMKNVSFPQ